MIGDPVDREEAAVDDLVAGRRLHPAVGARIQNDENSVPTATISGRDEMRPARHQLAAEQQHAEKRRFEEEGGQAFIGQQRRDDIGGGVGEAAPVGAELERHDDAGHHAHAEGDGEDPGPEAGDAEIDLAGR